MSFMKTVSVNITVGGQIYNSLSDLGLAISNTNYIGQPEQATGNLVSVPGRSGYLDLTDAVFGEQYYTHRKIKIEFGGLMNPVLWDEVVSQMRNMMEGKIVKIEFSTMPNWYFTGRAAIEAFEHKRALGTFTLTIPYASPYMFHDYTTTMAARKNYYTVKQLNVSRGIVIPTFSSEVAFRVLHQKSTSPWPTIGTYEFVAGTHTNPKIMLTPEACRLSIIGYNDTASDVEVTYSDQRL